MYGNSRNIENRNSRSNDANQDIPGLMTTFNK